MADKNNNGPDHPDGGIMSREAPIHAQERFGAALNTGRPGQRPGTEGVKDRDQQGSLTRPGMVPQP